MVKMHSLLVLLGELEGLLRRRFTHRSQLTISGTRMEPLEELARSLGDRVHIMGCDLSNGVEVENLSKGAQEKMGSVDILVNNAGITRDNLFLRMTDEDWASVLEVNLTSTMKLCRGVLRGMMKSRWGRIVNIGSVVGSTGNPGQGNYAASKAALVGMSKSLANEVASRGITVNCIAPGFVKTAMTEKLNEKQQEAIKLQIPAGRMGEVSDIAFASVISGIRRSILYYWINSTCKWWYGDALIPVGK